MLTTGSRWKFDASDDTPIHMHGMQGQSWTRGYLGVALGYSIRTQLFDERRLRGPGAVAASAHGCAMIGKLSLHINSSFFGAQISHLLKTMVLGVGAGKIPSQMLCDGGLPIFNRTAWQHVPLSGPEP